MKKQFLVELEVPEGAKIADCIEYITHAVQSWGGGYRPPGSYGEDDDGDPFFSLDRESVKVKRHYHAR